mmetsp:Transcript_22660/g.32461  ORF Transcript_22660/g.32461 Transcript_22660/m.32461 type:complete len:414 (-) Transcript_22660:111-1352(-)
MAIMEKGDSFEDMSTHEMSDLVIEDSSSLDWKEFQAMLKEDMKKQHKVSGHLGLRSVLRASLEQKMKKMEEKGSLEELREKKNTQKSEPKKGAGGFMKVTINGLLDEAESSAKMSLFHGSLSQGLNHTRGGVAAGSNSGAGTENKRGRFGTGFNTGNAAAAVGATSTSRPAGASPRRASLFGNVTSQSSAPAASASNGKRRSSFFGSGTSSQAPAPMSSDSHLYFHYDQPEETSLKSSNLVNKLNPLKNAKNAFRKNTQNEMKIPEPKFISRRKDSKHTNPYGLPEHSGTGAKTIPKMSSLEESEASVAVPAITKTGERKPRRLSLDNTLTPAEAAAAVKYQNHKLANKLSPLVSTSSSSPTKTMVSSQQKNRKHLSHASSAIENAVKNGTRKSTAVEHAARARAMIDSAKSA